LPLLGPAYVLTDSADPTKHATVTPSFDEDLPSAMDSQSPQASSHNSLQKHITPQPSTPRRRGHNHAHSLTLTRSQDGYSRSGSRSPERAMGLRGATLNSTSSSAMSSPANITTPLLMPPPTTRLDQIKHRGVLTLYQVTHWLSYHTNSYTPLLRLVFLGIKLFSLSMVCWPYSSNPGALGSVFILAALDLWNIGDRDQGGRASPRRNRDMVRVGVGLANREDTVAGASRLLSGWRRSCGLLALHFLMLWVTSRFGLLCAAARHDKWAEW
jgi:hypothetical protein